MASENIVILTEANFEKEVLQSEQPVLVDFWAAWCGPCKMQAPILHEFKDEMGDKVGVVKVDVDQNLDIAKQFGILSIPTILVFKNGELKEKKVGLSTKAQLSEMVIKHL